VRRFESGPAHRLVELFLGKPFGGAQGQESPIDSIQIGRFFLHNEKVLSLEQFSRVTGQEELVDIEPPQLTTDNRFDNWDDTLASSASMEARLGRA